MFQDYEYIPKKLISEYSLNDKLFDYIEAIKDMEDETIEALGYFLDAKDINNETDFNELVEEFNDEYQGYFDGSEGTEVEFVYKYIEEHFLSLKNLSKKIYEIQIHIKKLSINPIL